MTRPARSTGVRGHRRRWIALWRLAVAGGVQRRGGVAGEDDAGTTDSSSSRTVAARGRRGPPWRGIGSYRGLLVRRWAGTTQAALADAAEAAFPHGRHARRHLHRAHVRPLLTTFGVGFSLVVAPVYNAEIFPASARSILSSILDIPTRVQTRWPVHVG
uniref:Major facilitator superfamily (MFS) profile domain-containing protein n=1 Tax=Leersia perrieri TaxID=77586 RepID=A0A0D9XUI8_9ORYZ